MNTEEQQDGLSIIDLVATIYRWRRLLVITFFAVLIPGILVTFLMPPLYEAQARIFVRRDRNLPAFDVSASPDRGSQVYRNVERKEEVNEKAEILRSRSVVEAMVQDLEVTEAKLDYIRDARYYVRWIYKFVKNGLITIYNETKYLLRLSRRPTPEEQAYLEYETLMADATDRIILDILPDASIVQVKFRSSDPLMAMQAVNELCDEFIEDITLTQRAPAQTFFDEQTSAVAKALDELERKREEFRNEHATYQVEEQRRLLLSFLANTSGHLKATRVAKAKAAAKVAALKQQASREPKRIVVQSEKSRNPAVDSLNNQLTDLELNRSKAGKDFVSDNIILKRLQAEIADAEELLEEMPKSLDGAVISGVNPVHQSIREHLLQAAAEMASIEAEEAALRKAEEDYRAELAELSDNELKLNQLDREIEAQEEAYRLYTRNREQARVARDMDATSLTEVRVVDQAPLPLYALRPRRLLYSSIALAASLVVALAAPFFAAYNDDTLATGPDVRRFLRVNWVVSLPKVDVPADGGERGLVELADDTAIQEEADRLAEQIDVELPAKGSRVVTFTGSLPGEGVSTVSLAVALDLSRRLSTRVLLVNSNLRSPAPIELDEDSVHGDFIGALLDGSSIQEAVGRLRGHAVDVLFSGRSGLATLSQVSEERLAEALEELRNRYDYIVIDAAPPAQSPFSLTLAKLSDACVLVTHADKTSRGVVAATIERILRSGASLIGVALTQATEPWPARD